MGLQDDFQLLKKKWPSLSLLSKILLGTSFLISVNSVASIADATFTFKGFIAEALTFYRWLTHLLLGWIVDWFSFEPTQLQLDLLVLVLVSYGSLYRAMVAASSDVILFKFTALPIGSLVGTTLTMLVLGMFIPITVFSVDSLTIILGGLVISFLALVTLPLIGRRISGPVDRRISLYALSYLGAIVLLVTIVAGTSEGLARPV